MYQCLVCEDWLHESCTHRGTIKSSEFDCLVCDRCVTRPENAVLRDYCGMPGWMVNASDAQHRRVVLGAGRPSDVPVHPERREISAERFDMFLAHGFRESICMCEECKPRWKRLPFVVAEEETYDPPDDDDVDGASGTSASSSYERALAALGHLPRDRMLDSLRAYQKLRDALYEHLRPFAERHEPVNEEAVREFFRAHARSNR